MVRQFATTSNSGTGNSPGGSPTSTQVPRLRAMPTPCLNAPSDGAVMAAVRGSAHRRHLSCANGVVDAPQFDSVSSAMHDRNRDGHTPEEGNAPTAREENSRCCQHCECEIVVLAVRLDAMASNRANSRATHAGGVWIISCDRVWSSNKRSRPGRVAHCQRIGCMQAPTSEHHVSTSR
jgi:hypothetical protein